MLAIQYPLEKNNTDKQKALYPYNGMVFALSKEGFWTWVTAWMNPDHITLSEISQTQKDTDREAHCQETAAVLGSQREQDGGCQGLGRGARRYC